MWFMSWAGKSHSKLVCLVLKFMLFETMLPCRCTYVVHDHANAIFNCAFLPVFFLCAGVMDIGTIAGIAASIVVAILIVVLVAVTLMVCYSKCQPQHTSYPELKIPFDDNLACSPTHAPENDTTLVAANGAIKCHKSLDSGHEDSEDTTSSGGEGDFILSVQPEDQMDTPAKPTEGDSISEESISLENFGEEQEVAL